MPRLIRAAMRATQVGLLVVFATTSAVPANETMAGTSEPPTSLTVTADPVRREIVGAAVAGTGLVEPWQEVTIGAETSGLVLEEVLVSEGETVRQGQMIARLDATVLEAQRAEQDAAIESAEAQVESARSANERAARLAKTGNATAETVQEKSTALKTASAGLAQAEAVRRTLAVQVAGTQIRAPFAGVISAKPAVAGAVVQVGLEITRIQRDGILEVRLMIPEQRLGALAAGDAVTVTDPAGGSHETTIALLFESVDAVTHLATVTARLPAGSGLKAGMFVRGAIHSGGASQLTITEGALTWRDGQAGVFAVSADGTANLRAVESGARSQGRVAVTGDLEAGDRVVSQGAGFLSDGNCVLVVEDKASLKEPAR